MTNLLKGQCTYLAGPMDRIEDGGIVWRQELTPKLRAMGLGVLDPCDKPCAFGEEGPEFRDKINRLKIQGDFETAKALMRDISAIDLRMIDIAHFVIVYMNIDVHMCGTYHEAFTAVQQKKPILVMCEQGRENVPNWMFGVMPYQHMFDSWDDLLAYLDRVNSGEETRHYNRWRFFDFDKVYGRTN